MDELYGEKLPEVGSLAEALINLDRFLTQVPLHRAIHTHRNQGDNGCSGVYYLSDGGYSRVVLDPYQEWDGFFLTSNSTDGAKKRWELAGELIEVVRNRLRR